MSSPILTVVLPCYNESGNLPRLFDRLRGALDPLQITYELLCIDDGSRDDTYQVLLQERAKDKNIKVLRMARNFGKEIALTCGFHHARGQAVVAMDSDLQHPPEFIATLLDKWREGYQMVYALRQSREGDSWLRKQFTKLFYWTFGKICEIELPPGAGDFRLLDRAVVDAVNMMPERNRFMKGLVTWVGFRQTSLYFQMEQRASGTSQWGFLALLRLALDGMAAFSTLPLRIWSTFGIAISVFALLYLLYLVGRTIILGVDVPGFASLMVAILLLGGIQLISLGVIGEYLGRVFTEVKRRPLYLLSDKHGVGSSDAD
jgi:polyisoprenyl-phosphate glycosyltransferase